MRKKNEGELFLCIIQAVKKAFFCLLIVAFVIGIVLSYYWRGRFIQKWDDFIYSVPVNTSCISEIEFELLLNIEKWAENAHKLEDEPEVIVEWVSGLYNGDKQVQGLAITGNLLVYHQAGNIRSEWGGVSYAKLKDYARKGQILLHITLHLERGLTLLCNNETLLQLPNAKPACPVFFSRIIFEDAGYVSEVAHKTGTTLGRTHYKPKNYFASPFRKQMIKSLGRVMFCGDSITHGINDQSWRWQLFKILVDNEVEAEIVGPLQGYMSGYNRLRTSDAGDSYADVFFPNVHFAHSGGCVHDIIGALSNVRRNKIYGGYSTRCAADLFNCNTFCCMLGTNDLLSVAGYHPEQFAAKMQNLLGGKVSYNQNTFQWDSGKDWGNMGRMADDLLKEDTDELYVLAVPCWGRHHNNNQPERHLAVQRYNELLQEWVRKYSRAHGKKLKFVDVNKGMVDSKHNVPFSWPDSMSNKPGQDGLHPNEQGSMLIANNIAAAMRIPGRTAGLSRAHATGWNTGGVDMNLCNDVTVREAVFSSEKGYSVELYATVGEGTLEVRIGDEVGSSQLRFSAHEISWGKKTLYCLSKSEKGTLRLVWHPGMDGNRPKGYYVWWNGSLVGQALPPDYPTGLGLCLKVSESTLTADYLKYTDGSFAPGLQEFMEDSGVFLEESSKAFLPEGKRSQLVVRGGRMVLDKNTLAATLDGAPLELTTAEFKLLAYLMERPGKVQDRYELQNILFGYADTTQSRALDTHVKRLRQKLGDYAACIGTERGVGYYFTPEIEK